MIKNCLALSHGAHRGLALGLEILLLPRFAVPAKLHLPACALLRPSFEACFNEVPSYAHFKERLDWVAKEPSDNAEVKGTLRSKRSRTPCE